VVCFRYFCDAGLNKVLGDSKHAKDLPVLVYSFAIFDCAIGYFGQFDLVNLFQMNREAPNSVETAAASGALEVSCFLVLKKFLLIVEDALAVIAPCL
jgi:hypothetical protein